MKLGFENTRTEIYTIDSQFSLDGGVVVMVTGSLQQGKVGACSNQFADHHCP
jgi:hypothetical protein